MLVGLWIARRVIVGCMLVVSVTVNAVTAVTGTVIGNIHTNSLLFVAVALATSSFIPWGASA